MNLILLALIHLNSSLAAEIPAETVVNQSEESKRLNPSEEMLNLRDPFKVPNLGGSPDRPKTPLELFDVKSFRILGIMTGPKKFLALLQAPNGQTYFVEEDARIGTRGGKIVRIVPDAILVAEKTVNVLGEEEVVQTVLRLPAEADGSERGSGRGRRRTLQRR